MVLSIKPDRIEVRLKAALYEEGYKFMVAATAAPDWANKDRIKKGPETPLIPFHISKGGSLFL